MHAHDLTARCYNQAHDVVGGVYASSGHVNINNSTIVLNTAGSYTYTHNANTYNAAACC